MKPLFVLINGRGGVGKTTTLHALLESPMKDWLFFDFDNGKFPPPKEGESGGKEWRYAQHNWWIKVAEAQHKTTGMHVCVLGVGVFPWQVSALPHASLLDTEQYHYGMLTCTEGTRKKRLKQRGSESIQEYDLDKFRTIHQKLLENNVKEFSTDNRNPEEVAKEIQTWLNSLTV